MSQTLFLSYAHGDDEPFVARLHAGLTARGFDVWRERCGMTNAECRMQNESATWGQFQIWTSGFGLPSSFGIRHSTFARAITSDYVIAEWQHAVTYGLN